MQSADCQSEMLALRARIAELEQENARLRKSEDLYRLLADYSNDVISHVTPDGGVLYISPGCRRLMGYEPEELIGHSGLEHIHPDDISQLIETASEQFKLGDEATIVYRVQHKNGEHIWVENSIHALRDEPGGSYRGFVSSSRDVTVREQLREAQRRTEERYRKVVEASVQGIVVYQDGRVCYANPRVAKILGFHNPREIIGCDVAGFIAPEYRQQVFETVQQCLRGERSDELLIWQGIKRDGERIWIESVSTLIEWNNAPAAIGFFVDITERKQLEAQFLQSQKMDAIGRLAGGVAHDFNNLLTVIRINGELLSEMIVSHPRAKHSIDSIQQASDRAAALTRQLLTFSRKAAFEPRLLCPNDVIAQCEKLLRRLVSEDLQLICEFGPEVGRILVDPTHFEQVLLNLVVNARDAQPSGGVIRITTACEMIGSGDARLPPSGTAGNYVCIAVADQGSGMTPEVKAHLFEPFFTTKGVGQGTGLGLSTVHGRSSNNRAGSFKSKASQAKGPPCACSCRRPAEWIASLRGLVLHRRGNLPATNGSYWSRMKARCARWCGIRWRRPVITYSRPATVWKPGRCWNGRTSRHNYCSPTSLCQG